MADQQKKKYIYIYIQNVHVKNWYVSPSQTMCFLSYTHESERKCTRAKHHGKLRQNWNSFDNYLKTAYWHPRISPAHQVILLRYPRIPPAVQGLMVSDFSKERVSSASWFNCIVSKPDFLGVFEHHITFCNLQNWLLLYLNSTKRDAYLKTCASKFATNVIKANIPQLEVADLS